MALADKYKRTGRRYAEERALAHVAVKIGELLRRAGVSQRELARRMKTSEPRVSLLLSGKANPTIRSLARLADALGYKLRISFAANDNARCRPATREWTAEGVPQNQTDEPFKIDHDQVLAA